MNLATARAGERDRPIAIICGGGAFPVVVAEAIQRRGDKLMLFPLRGWANPALVERFPHRWMALGQFGRFCRIAAAEGCRDVVFIGTVLRPRVTQIRFDWTTLRLLPRIIGAFRGGDDHMLSTFAKIFEEYGFRLLGAHEVAPDILVPEGSLGSRVPSERDRLDIAEGLRVLNAMGPFDVGQAVVVADRHVVAVEAAEGTDQLLARVAALRQAGRLHSSPGVGVLVKAPKPGQDHRFDLPSIGPRTIEGAAQAGLAGIAVVAGGAIMAEPQAVAQAAECAGLFVIGVRNDRPEP